MIKKVNQLNIERYYYLESDEFLKEREQFFFKEDIIKFNSYCIGGSEVNIHSDRIIYLYNGLRKYYELRSRYMKNPKLLKRKPPLSKKLIYNRYFLIRRRQSDLFLMSLNKLQRPTIRLKKYLVRDLYYSFNYKLVNQLNFFRQKLIVKNSFELAKKNFFKNFKSRFLEGGNLKRPYSQKGCTIRRTRLSTFTIFGFKEYFWNNYIKIIELHKRNKILLKLLLKKKKKAEKYLGEKADKYLNKYKFNYLTTKKLKRKLNSQIKKNQERLKENVGKLVKVEKVKKMLNKTKLKKKLNSQIRNQERLKGKVETMLKKYQKKIKNLVEGLVKKCEIRKKKHLNRKNNFQKKVSDLRLKRIKEYLSKENDKK